nr:hypothetical protein [Tanacetum cinerariifolium]
IMAPKRTTATTTSTAMTDAQLKAPITQGVVDALRKLKQTELAEMVMTTMILELVAEEQSELVVSTTTMTSSNVNP